MRHIPRQKSKVIFGRARVICARRCQVHQLGTTGDLSSTSVFATTGPKRHPETRRAVPKSAPCSSIIKRVRVQMFATVTNKIERRARDKTSDYTIHWMAKPGRTWAASACSKLSVAPGQLPPPSRKCSEHDFSGRVCPGGTFVSVPVPILPQNW